MFKKLIHYFAHLTHQNEGKVVGWTENNICYVGFLCDGCGKIDKTSISKMYFEKEIENDSIIETK